MSYWRGPVTPILDDFNRATIGGDWSIWGGTGLTIVSDTLVRAASNNSGGVFNRYSGVDQEGYVSSVADTSNLSVLLRASVSPQNAYEVLWVASNLVSIVRTLSGSSTTMVQVAATRDAGDGLMGRVHGTTIEAWIRKSGVWSRVATVNDGALTGPGALGLWFSTTGQTADDFGGGTIAAPGAEGFSVAAGIRGRGAA